jgi:TRAP-type C4-dicarboxylate transport system permease small subunit
MKAEVAALGRAIRRVEITIAMAGMIAVVASVLWGVVTRYVSHAPAVWTDEVAAIAFCWSCLLGAALLYGTRAHPGVYEAQDIQSPAIRRVILPPSAAIQLFVLVMLCYFALQESWENLDNPTSVLRLPTSIFYLPLAWFGLSAAARLVARRNQWT